MSKVSRYVSQRLLAEWSHSTLNKNQICFHFMPDITLKAGNIKRFSVPLTNCPKLNLRSRVEFSFSAVSKHRLPVDSRCLWAHRTGTVDPHFAVCKSPDGRAAQNRLELWKCFRDTSCPINDSSLQLAVIRDPRAVTVSAYFMHVRLDRNRRANDPSYIDAYFRMFLETITMWVSIRYLLFTELLADQSLVLYYEDAVTDPLDWHIKYLDFVGVRLPPEQVNEAARVASGGGSILGFHSKGFDEHPGAKIQDDTRSFRDELSNSSLSFMDDVLRTWLPDYLLDKYDVFS